MPPFPSGTQVLGLDVGAVALSAAVVDAAGRVVQSAYALHHGEVRGTSERVLGGLDLREIGAVATTTSAPASLQADARFNDQICLITAGRRFHPEARSILIIGGERFGLVRFDESGKYLSFKANPLCAAGTGAFLDQQARRLNLPGTEALMELARANRDPPARIASRCAVFAKTDLVHAQQEGFSLEAICDGLCRGLAKNIVDTLFSGEQVHGPVLVVGGVSRNGAVLGHLRDLLAVDLLPDPDVPHPAAGAALKILETGGSRRPSVLVDHPTLWKNSGTERPYEYPPLELRLSTYPEFTSLEQRSFRGRAVRHSHPMEVDVYREVPPEETQDVYLGVDIGSTSTKAVVTDPDSSVIAGFYTATAGRPLEAVQLILEGITDWARQARIGLAVRGVGTTGAGRKFVGRILGADLLLDEITAHARAAVDLHPGVDTVIEIGGQDSKFMTLRDGRVTLSIMNSVCAAGTGSFVEEQAQRLGVSLTDFGHRTQGHPSPLASERCTVFMERDLNHYLREGYEKEEVLAAVLHSVRENYLNKVAVESAIGRSVVFQGATARNRALVAAFEQRLQRPIHVSKYCHLAGALGVALTLRDDGVRSTSFRGLNLYRRKIAVRAETCDLCTNHCKLSVAEVGGDTVAYGFLCGRDYQTRRHVRSNRSGFDLFRARKRAFRLPPGEGVSPGRAGTTIGIPAALHLFEDLPFWRRFFQRLGIPTLTSEPFNEAVNSGRILAGAELCAPLTALHGHVRHLFAQVDLVFLPFYLDARTPQAAGRRQYCYYTQYAPVLGRRIGGKAAERRILTPLVRSLHHSLFAKAELTRVLNTAIPGGVSWFEISAAFDEATRFKEEGLRQLREVYGQEARSGDDLHVVLLGRPYTVLSEWMNKRIPEIISSMGIRVFYQDMLTYGIDDLHSLQPLLEELHWHYAARILEAAEITARDPDAYPVLVTSFKCSPDSFVIEYFREIMEGQRKPYLVLQLDEHDSRLGYETRIEAALRAFRNHHRSSPRPTVVRNEPSMPPGGAGAFWERTGKVEFSDKTLLFPNWDSTSLRLVVASLRKKGLDARLLEPSEAAARRALRHNSGQCTPLNIIAQDFMEYVGNHDLDPARTVLWMAASSIACNIHLYPHHIRTVLRSHGEGFEHSEVYVGALSLQDISATLPFDAYLGYMFGGFVKKMGCAVRPYEAVPGETDRVIRDGIGLLEGTFESDGSKEDSLAAVVRRFRQIGIRDTGPRPEVAVFGDLYTRDNEVLNQDLIHFVESHGGQVITTPYTSFVKMVARPYYWKWFLEGKYLNLISTKAIMTALVHLEKRYFRYFDQVLQESEPNFDASPQDVLSEFNLRMEHTGESMENLLKIFYIRKHHPDVALFVQASPAFCCPSLVTEAMAGEIEEKTGVPMVSVTYDGTGGGKNEVILPYLEYPRARGGRPRRVQIA
jgi:predicted CoA-substrate-specific enzyme activase